MTTQDEARKALANLIAGEGEFDLGVASSAFAAADRILAAGCGRALPAPVVTEGEWNELTYARQLAVSLAAKYPDASPDWEPLPDLMGLLTQIDNATTGLAPAPVVTEARIEAGYVAGLRVSLNPPSRGVIASILEAALGVKP